MIQHIKSQVKVLQADLHMREVVRHTLLAFSLRVGGSGLTFAFNVAVARLLGAEGTGIYFLALAVTTVGSVISRVGLDNALLRFIAIRAAHDDWAGVKGVFALGMRMAVVVSGSVTFIVFLTAPWMASAFFKKPELAEPLRWMSLSILPFTLLNLHAESLKGLARIRDAMLVQGIGIPLIGLLLIVPMVKSAGVLGVGFTYVASTLLVTVLGVWAWLRAVSGHAVAALPFPFKEIWANCRPLWGVSILNGAVLPWMSLFLLGVWSTSEEVGVYGAATRVAMLVSFFLLAVVNVVAPKFARLYARGEIETLGRVARQSALLMTVLAIPILVVMIFAGGWVMSLYGKGFTEGGVVLATLAFGQLVNATCGPAGTILIMTGHAQQLRNGTLIALLSQLTLCVGLIPLLGMKGAAVATVTGGIVNNLIAVFYVQRLIGIAYPFKFGGNGV